MVKQLVLGIESMDVLTGLPSLQTTAQGEQPAELAPFLCSFRVLANVSLNAYRCLLQPLSALEQCCAIQLSVIMDTVCNQCCPIQEPLAICG